MTWDALGSVLEQWQRDVLAKLDIRNDRSDVAGGIIGTDTGVQLNAGASLQGRASSSLPTVLSRVTDGGRAQDQRFLPMVSAGNILSVQNVFPLSATADATTASITVADHILYLGYGSISYTGATITGLTPDETYYVYADDPDFAGGVVTYEVSTSKTDVPGNNGRYFVGQIDTAIAATSATVSAATNANPCAITVSASHGWTTGNQVAFSGVGGMTQLNGNTYTITVTGATTFTLNGVDSSAFGVYTSGGTATRVSTPTSGGGGGGGGWIDFANPF